MSLIHTDTDIATLKINRFSTVEDYELAIQQGLIGENEISIIDENFQPDWNQSDPSAPDFIKNKPTNLQGAQGIQGLQGTKGSDGQSGSQGTQGIQGIQGTKGTQGTQGIQGTKGSDGQPGSQGIQGLYGIQGFYGIQGLQGGAGSTNLSGLTDTDISTPVAGDNLIYNGVQWVNHPEIYKQATPPADPIDKTVWIDTDEDPVIIPAPTSVDAGKILSVDSGGNYVLEAITNAEHQQY